MTADELVRAIGCRPDVANTYAPFIENAAYRWGLDYPYAVAAWLGMISVESARLTKMVEDLRYSATRMAQVWPRRFRDRDGRPNDLALRIAGDPEALANEVYGGRYGNGGPSTGDGWLYRGRGAGQITFRANYRDVGRGLKLDLEGIPELLELPEYAIDSSAWWFAYRISPGAVARRDTRAISVQWNGGEVGLRERIVATERAYGVLNAG